MSINVTRRSFLSSAGVTIASVASTRLPAEAAGNDPAARKTIGVRQNVTDMGDDHPVIKSYRKAVAAMKELKSDNPLSWAFQANMHGARKDDGNDSGWRWCMHQNWWFLPWHRGYLLFFERIVRKLSNDDGFRLPYWAWEKLGQDVLPMPFRRPGPPNDRNALYDETRFADVNAGKSIRRPDMQGTFARDWANAERVRDFTTRFAVSSYGGLKVGRVAHPQHPSMSGSYGVMEAQAHNRVHVCVAPERGGNMSDPNTAARDPIFWLHHANVDRLWNRWLDVKGHYNPNEAEWADQEFPFYDENGRKVVVSVLDILGRAAESYRYNDDQEVRFGDKPKLGKMEAPMQVMSPVAAALPMLALSTTPFTKPLAFEPNARPRLVGALATAPPPDAPPPAVVLRVENLQPPANAGVTYEVFVTKAGGKPAAKYYIGPITFFGRGGNHEHDDEGGKPFTQDFDATEVLQQIRRENKNELPDLQVSIVPHSTDPAVSDEELAKKEIKVPMSNVTLKIIEEEKKK